MIGITILSSHPSEGTKAIYCQPTIYKPSGSDSSVYPSYTSLAGTAARCYVPRKSCYLPGPTYYLSGWDCSRPMPRTYRSTYGPCSYEYLLNNSQGYYDPCVYKYLSKGVQRSYDPYGLEYLYSYRRRYYDPCDYSYNPSYGRRYCDPCVYNNPPSYGRSSYSSRGYTYRCGFSNNPCGYSCAPGYRQPRYADRRRYSSRPVSSDPYGSCPESPYASECRRLSSDSSSYCGPC